MEAFDDYAFRGYRSSRFRCFSRTQQPRWLRRMVKRIAKRPAAICTSPSVIFHFRYHHNLYFLAVLTNILDKKVMGAFVNGIWVRAIISFLSLFVIGVNVYFVIDFVLTSLPGTAATYSVLALSGTVYICFLVSY